MTSSQNPRTPQHLLEELYKTLKAGDPNSDQSIRRNALRLSSALTASLQTPEELAFETCFLPAYSACCRAGIHLQLFDAIAESTGPVTANELALKTGVERLLIVRILRVITSLGLVAETGPETYHALPTTHAMTFPMIRAAHQHFWDQGLASLFHLPSYLAINGPRCPTDARNGLFQHAFATNLDAFSYWQAQPSPRRALDNFNFLQTCIRGPEPAWLTWFPVGKQILDAARPGGVVLVDVGGGIGHDALAFLKRCRASDMSSPENSRVVLEDLPAVLADAHKASNEGVERVEYDFFTPQVIIGARTYYYAHILHDWPDEACTTILRNAASAMERGYSKILLYEFILPDTGCSRLQAGFDIQMMGMHAGMERTRSMWTRLLEGAGFRVVRFWMPPGEDMEGIVEAELMDDDDDDRKEVERGVI